MNRFLIAPFALAALVVAPPVMAQASAQPPVPKPAERVVELEGLLARQTTIADNARQEVEALRAEIRLKDELLVLGRERNAELHAIAKEITEKYVRSRSVDPFIQSSRVKMENLRQSYEDRLHAARIYEGTLPPSVQQRMDAELGAPGASGAADPATAPASQN